MLFNVWRAEGWASRDGVCRVVIDGVCHENMGGLEASNLTYDEARKMVNRLRYQNRKNPKDWPVYYFYSRM